LEELDAAEAQRAAVGGEDEAESTFVINTGIDNLENRITFLEATFAHLKEMRARKGNDGASSSKAISSIKQKNKRVVVSFDLFRLVVALFSSSCFV
jgi:uncharacterized small protein (DUF1192 family)